MYIIRKHEVDNKKDNITLLFVTDESYAKRYTKYHNDAIKEVKSYIEQTLEIAKKVKSGIKCLSLDYIIKMAHYQKVCDYIHNEDDLKKEIYLDYIELPFYEGGSFKECFIPDAHERITYEKVNALVNK